MADRNGYIGRAPSDSSVVVARQTFSPTGITTTFTFASGYTVGYLMSFSMVQSRLRVKTTMLIMVRPLIYQVVELQMAMSLRQSHIKHLTYLM